MSNFDDKILMCPPDHFTVDYVINPWMAGHEESLSIEKAKQQWQTLRDMVAEFADVVTLDPDPDLPDMVFTANAGVIYGNKAIASHFMPMERRPEEPIFKQWFRDNGFDLLQLDEKIGFEGAGELSGGIMATGAYPGKARTPDELRSDVDKAMSLIPMIWRQIATTASARTSWPRPGTTGPPILPSIPGSSR